MTRTDGNRSGGSSTSLAAAGLANSYSGSRSGALEAGR